MKRNIIRIDESKCDGCGLCVPDCPEGTLQIIDGKARLVSDLFCDGLGACLGTCPKGAITVEEREAEPYDEKRVMVNIVAKGANTIKAHLEHLLHHGEKELLKQALDYLNENNIPVPELKTACSCSTTQAISPKSEQHEPIPVMQSELRQWPVQLHLLNPGSPVFDNAELLISADCAPYTVPDFHSRYIRGKTVITLCPMLDQGIDRYISKLAEIFRSHQIKSIYILRMQVPCCGGLEMIVQKAMSQTTAQININVITLSIEGQIIEQRRI
ncbi:MAG: 4Fe-4S binding protein [Candidatus Cloacimonetes bacterium]|nr:4Fe-4S binding protein [Candidatus Cloacimonadota bacterium]